MSRTDMDAATLARSLRRMAGDGGMEWCCEPIRASVLLDVADLLDEGDRLREQGASLIGRSFRTADKMDCLSAENESLRELVRTMAYCMQYERECDGCRLNGADGAITEHAGCDGLRELIRELGVSDG